MPPSPDVDPERPRAPVSVRLPRAAWKVVIAGVLIREAFAFWTGHPYDLEVWIRTGNAVAHGLNPYAYWPAVPGVSIAYLNSSLPSAAYLPFWPLLTGGIYRLWEAVPGGNRFLLYGMLKQPPILGDALTAVLLYRIAARWSGRPSKGLAALTFWSFFPYAIVISAVWGQFDSLVVAVVLAALWYRSSLARNLLYGVGILVKWITAIYLPLEALAERGWRRLWVLVAVALPLAVTVVVFLSMGWGFQNVGAASVSQTHGGGGGMNWVGIVTSPPVNPFFAAVPYLEPVLSYLWVPGVIVAGALGARWFASGRPEAVLRAMVLVTGTFLLLRWGLYEQYMLYLFALVLLDVVLFHPGRQRLFYGVIALSFAYLLINNDLGMRFVSPLSPSVTAYTDALDASPTFGLFRVYALIVLAALVTATLVQLLATYYQGDPAPAPWWHRLRPTPAVRASPVP